jgi:hypothetical protein
MRQSQLLLQPLLLQDYSMLAYWYCCNNSGKRASSELAVR